MNLTEYLETTTQSDLASKISVTQGRISQIVTTGKVPVSLCLAIERATNGLVTRPELRPNDWRNYWPELDPDNRRRNPYRRRERRSNPE